METCDCSIGLYRCEREKGHPGRHSGQGRTWEGKIPATDPNLCGEPSPGGKTICHRAKGHLGDHQCDLGWKWSKLPEQPANKYHRKIKTASGESATVDIYDVLIAYDVTCPARAHAIKKLLCAGIRGKGDAVQDLTESIACIQRAVELEKVRTKS